MGCLIALLIFIFLLFSGALSKIISIIWSIMIFINDYFLIIGAIFFIIYLFIYAINKTNKYEIKKELICNRKYNFIIDRYSLYNIYKNEDISNYDIDILEIIRKNVEQIITQDIYKMYIKFYVKEKIRTIILLII